MILSYKFLSFHENPDLYFRKTERTASSFAYRFSGMKFAEPLLGCTLINAILSKYDVHVSRSSGSRMPKLNLYNVCRISGFSTFHFFRIEFINEIMSDSFNLYRFLIIISNNST